MLYTTQILREWDNLIRKFIWDAKKTQVKLKNLKLPKSGCWLALPDLETYFKVAQTKSLIVWISDTNNPRWKEIESEMRLIKSAIFKIPDREVIKSNYCIESTFKAWRRIAKDMRISNNDTII